MRDLAEERQPDFNFAQLTAAQLAAGSLSPPDFDPPGCGGLQMQGGLAGADRSTCSLPRAESTLPAPAVLQQLAAALSGAGEQPGPVAEDAAVDARVKGLVAALQACLPPAVILPLGDGYLVVRPHSVPGGSWRQQQHRAQPGPAQGLDSYSAMQEAYHQQLQCLLAGLQLQLPYALAPAAEARLQALAAAAVVAAFVRDPAASGARAPSGTGCSSDGTGTT